MERHFLRAVDERTNAANSYEQSVVLYCTLVDKPLSLIESLRSRKATEFSKISQVYFRAV